MRFADIQILPYRVTGFEHLTLRQQTLIYHLSKASLWGRDILWDQNGCYNLRIRRLLERVYLNFDGERESLDFRAFTEYLRRVWFSNGIHHHYGGEKFQPGFSAEFLKPYLQPEEDDLLPVIFDSDVQPKRLNQQEGDDLVLTSSCNYYGPDITQAEAEAFYAQKKSQAKDPSRPVMFGMNSTLIRHEGKLKEDVWRSGGRYGIAIDHITQELEAALPYAENERQADVIRHLISFYRTGDLVTFDEYSILWVEETQGEVDFVNGFIEVYGDPLGLKASWEGYVNFTDREATRRTETLCRHAQWFEDHSPVDPRFRKKNVRGVSARVVNAAILGGDLYPSSAIGINLPNSNWIRAEHGSKSVTIGNLTKALDEAARGNGFREEFIIDRETLEMVNRYAFDCDDLHTDLHECLGHGSGQLLPGVDPDALKAYGSTIEEARADLFGLYYIADPKMVEIGLLPSQEAYKAQYYTYLMNGLLTQLVRIEEGRQIEEAHMRNRALIACWTLAHYPEAVKIVQNDGKSAVCVTDYERLRQAFGTLLAEIQRIKSEGDYEAARQIVETYGVSIDSKLHHEIRQRYNQLHLAPYKGFINPRYTAMRDNQGRITSVGISYDEEYDEQMLRYSREYATL